MVSSSLSPHVTLARHRYALKHPMSDPDIVNNDGLVGAGPSFMQSTQSIKNRQRPRQEYHGRPRARMRTVGAGGVVRANAKAGGGSAGNGGGAPTRSRLPAAGPSNPTLANIEHVLDRMSQRMEEHEASAGGGGDGGGGGGGGDGLGSAGAGEFLGPDLGTADYSTKVMGNLIGMVNNVMSSYEGQ